MKYVTRELLMRRNMPMCSKGDANWQGVQVPAGKTYAWDDQSTTCRTRPISSA